MNTNHNRCRLQAGFLALTATLFCLHASASTFSLNPSADAFVTTGPSGNLSINNYGGAGAPTIAALNLFQGEFQNVLQFRLSRAKNAFDFHFRARQWGNQSLTPPLTPAP